MAKNSKEQQQKDKTRDIFLLPSISTYTGCSSEYVQKRDPTFYITICTNTNPHFR